MFRSASNVSALLLSVSVVALVAVSDEVRAADYTWYGSNTTFASWSNWRDAGGGLPSPANNAATFVSTNNFIISGVNSSFNPNIFASLTVGTITIDDLSLNVYNGATLTTAGVIVNNAGGLTTRAGSALTGDITVNNGGRWGATDTTHTGNVTINNGGTWVAGGWVTNTGNVTNAGTMDIRGNNVSGITTLNNSGTVTGSDGLRASTIINSGSITGTVYGLNLTNAVTLTNSGTIIGGTSAVRLGANGNTININPGAVFTGGIDYNNTTGNTTAFGSGSYTLAVKNYSTTGNRVTTADASTVVSMTNNGAVVYSATGAPSTTIAVVNASGTASAVQSQTQELTGAVSSVVGDIVSQVNIDGIDGDSGAGSTDSRPAALGYAKERAPANNSNNPFNSQIVKPAQGVVVDGRGNLFWARAFGGARYQPAVGSLPATQSYYGGAVTGYDRRFDDWRLGGFAGYGNVAQYSSNGSGDVKGDVYFGGVYGRHEIGQWAFDLSLTGGSINNKSARYITVNAGTETAKATFSGLFVTPEAALSYAYKIDPAWTLTTTGRLRYTGSFYGGYSETGSSQNITYGAQSVHMLEERAEMRLGHAVTLDDGSSFNSYVQGAALGINRLSPNSTPASVLGTNITLNSASSSNLFGAGLGTGFDWKVKKDITVFAGAEGLVYSNSSYGASARVGVRISF